MKNEYYDDDMQKILSMSEYDLDLMLESMGIAFDCDEFKKKFIEKYSNSKKQAEKQ